LHYPERAAAPRLKTGGAGAIIQIIIIMEESMDLQEIRRDLDGIDGKISSLYEERLQKCADVAEYKMKNGKAVFDRAREEEKLADMRKRFPDPFTAEAEEELMKQMMTVARRYQYRLFGEKGKLPEIGFSAVQELPKAKRAVYQGTEGAYSQAAANAFFRQNPEVKIDRADRFEDAVSEAESGKADYCVIPIENSSAGAVTDTYDLLMRHNVFIAGEYFLPIRHVLLGVPGASLSDIKTVYSHPQGLAQCRDFLNGHREWKPVGMENTAFAAKKVHEDNDVSEAAIASAFAGELYGLKTLLTGISGSSDNTTRFAVLTAKKIYRADAGRVSLVFELPDKSGSLYGLLGNFIFNGINMVKIESRPVPGKKWQYRFFIDIEGNLSDPAVMNALYGIREEAAEFKILGNY
jgi:chorismate mutase/prephenate dehydratase